MEEAEKLNKECQAQYEIYVKNSTIEATNAVQKNKTPFDTLGMYKAGVAALKAAIECDKFDATPNEKGKVKLRYRKDNQDQGPAAARRLPSGRPTLQQGEGLGLNARCLQTLC